MYLTCNLFSRWFGSTNIGTVYKTKENIAYFYKS